MQVETLFANFSNVLFPGNSDIFNFSRLILITQVHKIKKLLDCHPWDNTGLLIRDWQKISDHGVLSKKSILEHLWMLKKYVFGFCQGPDKYVNLFGFCILKLILTINSQRRFSMHFTLEVYVK